MDKTLDDRTRRIRRNLTLGCAGLIAMPYTLGLSLFEEGVGDVGLILLLVAAALSAWGLKELRTAVGWAAVGACAVIAVCAALALFIGERNRFNDELAWSYVGALGLGPGLLGIFAGIHFARHQLLGTPVMLLLGGSLAALSTALVLDNRDHAALGITALVLGFGLTMAGPSLLTFRPLPSEETRA
ncbi:MAG: hypothetical protein IT385_29180 [Deltaproteobacteria bacterium]|nr:hypothetical protein [Deltaproteobacteria bacterium]